MTLQEFLASFWGQIVIQGIGFIAMALGIYSFQLKKRASIILCQMGGSCLWATQFLILGTYSGAIQNTIAIARNAVLAQREKHHWASSRITAAIIYTLITTAGVLTVMLEGYWALLTVGAMLLQTFAFYFTNANAIRRISLCVCALWLVYDVHAGSIAGVCCEIFGICSIIIALIRYRRTPSENNRTAK